MLTKASTARRSTGAEATRPSVKISAKPSSSRSCGSRVARIGRHGGSAGDVEQAAAGTRQLARDQCCNPGIEIRIAREADIERFELSRGLEQQPWSLCRLVLDERECGLKPVDAGHSELVERSGLRHRQKPTNYIERPSL